MSDGTVLVVDDEPANIQTLYAMLKDQATVLFARDGEEALTVARREHPDVVLLDVIMPDPDGPAVCEQLKADPATRDTVVVFISGLHDPEEMERSLAAGGVDFVTKPFHPTLMQAKVATLLDYQRLRRGGPRTTLRPREAPEGPQRVLVVEDGEINRMVVWQLLERAGHQPVMAASAEEALEMAAEMPFDAVLMDIHLPGMDGVEATRRMRATDAGQVLRIVAVTGDVFSGVVGHYLESGFDTVVRKPVDPDALDRALRGEQPESAGAGTETAAEAEDDSRPQLLIDDERLSVLRETYSPARLRALFTLFDRETRGYVATIRKACDAGDVGRMADTAHRLKSALGHFACKRVAAVADRLAHRPVTTVDEATERDVAALETLLPDTLSALRGVLDLVDPGYVPARSDGAPSGDAAGATSSL